MIAVIRNPIKIARNRLFKVESALTISGEFRRSDILPDMMLSPMKSTPKPRMTSPILLTTGFLQNITMMTPAIRNTGATSDRLKATSCEVIVVPILAPMITPAAWYRFISPEFTKLTTMTVVALED